MQSILIIEDEERIAHWVKSYFENAGFRTVVSHNGLDGLQLAQSEHFDLIILDLMLPGMDGMQICRTLRKYSAVPIIILTARDAEKERIAGLDYGADDYVTKPFSPGELLARARAVLRRTQPTSASFGTQTLRYGEISLNLEAHQCKIGEQVVELSLTQFRLLQIMLSEPGKVFSRKKLLDLTFEGDNSGFERTIDVHIRRLRSRIEPNPDEPKYILTVFGVGYKFAVLEETQ